MKLEFSRLIFEKKYSNINFMKILQLGAELFHAEGRTDGQTDMTKLIVASCLNNKHGQATPNSNNNVLSSDRWIVLTPIAVPG
jgi:hypothetical protein